MYSFSYTNRFKRGIKRVNKYPYFKKEMLGAVLDILLVGKKLPLSKKDHALGGDLAGFRDCHVQNDIVLIYCIDKEERIIELYDIGTHSELFS